MNTDSAMILLCMCICFLFLVSGGLGGFYWWFMVRPMTVEGDKVFTLGPVRKLTALSTSAKGWGWADRMLQSDLIWHVRHMNDDGTRVAVTPNVKVVYRRFLPNPGFGEQKMKITVFGDDKWELNLRGRDDKPVLDTTLTGSMLSTPQEVTVPAGGAVLEVTAWNSGTVNAYAGLAVMVENEKGTIVLRSDGDWLWEKLA